MKKALSLVMVVIVLATSFWFNVGTASAQGTNLVLYIPGITKQDAKHVTMFVNSNYVNLYCVLQDAETGKLVCNVPGKYAGENVRVYIAGRMFFVKVPEIHEHEQTPDTSLTCTPPSVLGATVTFLTFSEGTETVFVAGETLAEVESNAQGYLGEVLVSIVDIGELYCHGPI